MFETHHDQGQSTARFERIKFKVVTTNNRKKRAAQTLLNVAVDLFVKVPGGLMSFCFQRQKWVKVASHWSTPLIGQGRSPKHFEYKQEGLSRGTEDSVALSSDLRKFQALAKIEGIQIVLCAKTILRSV